MHALQRRALGGSVLMALAASPAAAQQQLVVEEPHIVALDARLTPWAAALPPAERTLWDGLLRRAAAAPGGGGEVRVVPVLHIGPGGGCETLDQDGSRAGIIVQGGREADLPAVIVQGGRQPGSPEGLIVQGGRETAAPRPGPPGGRQPGSPGGIIVQGGREAAAPAGVATPGARDPRPTGGCAVAIGPKQDDPAPPPQSLGRRIAHLAAELEPGERAALNWLLSRAASGENPARPGTPGGPAPLLRPVEPAGGRPGTPGGPTLRRALGIDAVAIGPKQDDPTPPPPSRWILRY